jgi:predicted SAM-dependent methyltransferase
MKLNLGCYNDFRDGYIHHDKKRYFKFVDVAHDLEKFPYPWKDNTFEEIICQNVLEHITPENTIAMFKELHRICEPNAIIKIRVPYGQQWMRDLDHKRGFNFFTFMKLNDRTNYKTGKKWEIIKMEGQAPRFGIAKYIPNFKVYKQLGFRDILGLYINYLNNNIYVELKVVK